MKKTRRRASGQWYTRRGLIASVGGEKGAFQFWGEIVAALTDPSPGPSPFRGGGRMLPLPSQGRGLGG
jgi:hypothetical protein